MNWSALLLRHNLHNIAHPHLYVETNNRLQHNSYVENPDIVHKPSMSQSPRMDSASFEVSANHNGSANHGYLGATQLHLGPQCLSPQHARIFGESQCCHSVLRNSRDSFNKLFDFLDLEAVVDNVDKYWVHLAALMDLRTYGPLD